MKNKKHTNLSHGMAIIGTVEQLLTLIKQPASSLVKAFTKGAYQLIRVCLPVFVMDDFSVQSGFPLQAGKEARKSASKSKKTKVDDDQPTITDFLNGAGPSSKQSGSKRKRDSGPETK